MHGSKADHTASPPLAERLDPDRLLLTEPARQIYYDENAVTVTTDRYDIHAQRVIVATSPAIAGRISYSPPLPAARDQLCEKMTMGTIAKVIAVYHNPSGVTGSLSSSEDHSRRRWLSHGNQGSRLLSEACPP